MQSRHRDGLLGIIVGGILVVFAVRQDATATLTDPRLLGIGGTGALAIELVLARFPATSAALWGKQWIRVLGAGLVITAGGFTAVVAPRLLGVLVGGLVAYLLLLGLVLAGVVPGAESWFDR